MNEYIAIIDDEYDIAHLIEINLTKYNYNVSIYTDGNSFIKSLEKSHVPELIILDLMLPDIDGIEICKFIRNDIRFSDIPIIMLTAKTEEYDKIIGLELGADDYITKPFSVRELIARVKSILRRKNREFNKNIININNILIIDENRYEVFIKNKKIDLTITEFRILKLLASKPGRVFSRSQILKHLWGNDKIVIDRTIDVHIKHLRNKLKDLDYIKNVRGIGYKIEI